MIRLSLEHILAVAAECGVEVTLTPSATPFVIATPTGLRRLSPAAMATWVCNEILDDRTDGLDSMTDSSTLHDLWP